MTTKMTTREIIDFVKSIELAKEKVKERVEELLIDVPTPDIEAARMEITGNEVWDYLKLPENGPSNNKEEIKSEIIDHLFPIGDYCGIYLV